MKDQVWHLFPVFFMNFGFEADKFKGMEDFFLNHSVQNFST